MIKKLIKKIEINKKLNIIKKHFKVAKKHKSCEELEIVKFELIDLQGELIELKKFSNDISLDILHLFEQIENARLKLTQIDLARVGYYS